MVPATLTCRLARRLDYRATVDYAVPVIVLMENAGRGVADKLVELGISGPVVICCGPGNNGGDGFVIARHLDLRGVEVKVIAWGDDERRPAEAATNLQILSHSGIRFIRGSGSLNLAQELAGAAWIVDSLLGTGVHGEVRPAIADVITAVNATGLPVMAVDLPSGLDADTGQPARPTIRAQQTCTFVAFKRGFLTPGAERFTGQIHVVDIGAPRKLVEEILAADD